MKSVCTIAHRKQQRSVVIHSDHASLRLRTIGMIKENHSILVCVCLLPLTLERRKAVTRIKIQHLLKIQ